jgi:alkaline phosphatase D
MPGGGMPLEVVSVEWEVATDDRMGTVVQRGVIGRSSRVRARRARRGRRARARTLVLVPISSGREVSAVGRTRTAPAGNAEGDRLRFAFASCQQYEQGLLHAYRHMLGDDLDVIVHLGDYIYESSWGQDHVRKHGAPEPHTLDDYRIRHALYKSDPDLRAAHAACPWLMTWDDHEVQNDYANDRSEHLDTPAWFLDGAPPRIAPITSTCRYRAGWRRRGRACASTRASDSAGSRTSSWSTTASIGRTSRAPRRAGRRERRRGLQERLDPRITMFGEQQEQWLTDELGRSGARWNLIAQQTLMAQLDRKPGPGQRILDRRLGRLPGGAPAPPGIHRPAQAVESGGAGWRRAPFWVTDLKPDFGDPRSPVVATEFVGTSITSQFRRPQSEVDALLADNPHIRFGNGTRRGYVRMEITRERLRADLRTMRSVSQRSTEADTLATFVVEDGRPGAVRA